MVRINAPYLLSESFAFEPLFQVCSIASLSGIRFTHSVRKCALLNDEREIEDTIIHEMIHYFIGVKRLEDSSSHGPMFQHLMKTINEKYGRNITISHKTTESQREELIDKKPHYHVVAVVSFTNGKTGIKVLPRVLPRILNYYNKVREQKTVVDIKLYMSNDIYFNRFPNSSALNVHYVEPSELEEHIKDAEVLGCDGKTITRNKK